MNLQKRIDLLEQLGNYILNNEEQWQAMKQKAFSENHWFIPEFIDLSAQNIAHNFLQKDILQQFARKYALPAQNDQPHKVGVVLAGNIPMVGFHDVLCVFLSGHYAYTKPSSKDETLIRHLVGKIIEWDAEAEMYLVIGEMLKGCDAYIATGSNNTSRYFEYYFRNYPHIIRKNRTSIAVLNGKESRTELEALADDVYQYFGLGCRNVTKLFVPQGYDFKPLLDAFSKYNYLINHHKYKNNYDYNLAVHILNNRYYMTNGSILLVEDPTPFSPISQLHYEYYTDRQSVEQQLTDNNSVQCVVGRDFIPFGQAQCPAVDIFADGTDTMEFLKNLPATSSPKEVRNS